MRLSTAPLAGTVSAAAVAKYSTVQRANTGAPYLLIMVRFLRGRWFSQDFRFGSKIDDLEADRITSARLRILCGFRIQVLNGRHPMRVRLFGSGALPCGL